MERAQDTIQMDALKRALFGTSGSGGGGGAPAAAPKTPQDMAKEWRRQLNHECRQLDKQVRKIQQEELKAKKAAKIAAKQDPGSVRILAKEIIHARQAVKRLITTKTQMNSVATQLSLQASQLKVAGAMKKSTDIMTGMNQLCKVSEIGQVMRAMSMEMTKAGLIEEMMSDTIDNALDDDVSESELDDEVKKVITEVTQDALKGTEANRQRLPVAQAVAEPEVGEDVEEEEDEDLNARLKALKGSA